MPDLAGLDWDAVLADYRPLLDRIAGLRDFADLLWEILGELGSRTPTSCRRVPAAATGRLGVLGADLERAADGRWLVARIMPGESSDPRACSPLAAPGVGAAPGDALLAVDGQPVGPAGPGRCWPARRASRSS